LRIEAYQRKIFIDKLENLVNLNISESSIPFLRDKKIEFEDKSSIRFVSNNELVFNKKNFGKFIITKKFIKFKLYNKFNQDVFLSTALNQPIACYEYLNKNIVLHCSAFEYKGKSNILLGLPKSGKSTLLGVGLDKVKFITEDIGIIRNKQLLPSTPLIKLQKENISEEYFEDLSPIPSDERKRIVCRLKTKYFSKSPKPINKIFFIERGNQKNIKNIEPKYKLAKLFSSSFRPNEFSDTKDEKDFFSSISQLLEVDMKELNISLQENPTASFLRLLDYIDNNS
tara:strand:- start:98 stop:949 length:852 start_codon:yes stop_codon:yes gene_type:complete